MSPVVFVNHTTPVKDTVLEGRKNARASWTDGEDASGKI
jgi:hypothetical protein